MTTTDGEFDDIPRAFGSVDIVWSRLLAPPVLRVVVGLLIALAVMLWPGRTDSVLVWLVAVLLVVVSIQVLVSGLRRRPRDITGVVAAIVGLAVALILFADTDRTPVAVGRLTAIVIGILAVADFVRALRRGRPSDGSYTWPVAKLVALLSVAVSLALYPASCWRSSPHRSPGPGPSSRR